jgi:glycosyltransferase involved in cell wall biosynthesis
VRILVATASQTVVGGLETYLRAVLPMLSERGHEVALMSAYEPAPDRASLGFPGLPIRVAADPAAARAVADEWRPDVVYTQNSPDPAVDAALAGRFPTVLFTHDYAGACISGAKRHALPLAVCSRRLGPACLGLYFPRRCGGLSPATALTLYRTNRRRQDLLPRYRTVIVASHAMAADFVRNGVPAGRVSVNPYFPATKPDAAPPAPRPRTDRVLFVGRITALKGWREIVQAIPVVSAALRRPLTLVVAGDGPDRGAFEREARRRRVQAEFLGWIGPEERDAQMRAADVLAVPSVWPEPFGLVGIEAGGVGLPSVGYAVGGIPDWLIDNESGALAPGDPPTVDGLASALVRALSDSAHLDRLRLGAWEVAKTFTAARHLDRLEEALTKAARG